MNRPEFSDLALSVAEAASIDDARSLGTESYSQWVRKVIRTVRSERNLLVSLFDSSVPEPIELLRQFVVEGFSERITSRYTSAFASGNPYVVEQLARRYAVPADQVVCTTGATGALSLIYRALLKPGDRVLVENPGFDLFHKIAETYGFGVDRFERRGEDFGIDPEDVAAAITPDTRLIVLSNLHNPSGMAVPSETLAAIGRIAEARGIHVIVDEVYGDYVDPALRPPPAMQVSPALISVSSLASARWRRRSTSASPTCPTRSPRWCWSARNRSTTSAAKPCAAPVRSWNPIMPIGGKKAWFRVRYHRSAVSPSRV
jgi:hypothetical protein